MSQTDDTAGTPPAITESALRAAVISLIGQAALDAIEANSGFVAAHERACMRAFLDARAGPEVDCVRAAMLHLNKRGQYPFYERG